MKCKLLFFLIFILSFDFILSSPQQWQRGQDQTIQPQGDPAYAPAFGYNAPQNYNQDTMYGQRLPQPQQDKIFDPYSANNYATTYPEPFGNQQQRNYGKYEYGYQPPSPLSSNPVDNSYSWNVNRDPWSSPNQYNHMYAQPYPYPYQNTLAREPQYVQPIQNGYNAPVYPAYAPVLGDSPVSGIPPESLYQDDLHTVSSKQKHYVIVYKNETYEHVDNIDSIVANDPNDAHIKSKDEIDNILAVIEIEDQLIKETEYEKSLELPYDTGISKIPQDTSWDPNYQDYSGTLGNYKHPIALRTELYKQFPEPSLTYEDTDMKYFKPEYIMPIQSPTANSFNSATNTALPNTNSDRNVDETTGYFDNLYPLGYDYNRPMYNSYGKAPTKLTPSAQDIPTNGRPPTVVGDDYPIGLTDHPSSPSPPPYPYDSTRDIGSEKVIGNDHQEKTATPPVGNGNVVNETAFKESSGTNTPKQSVKLRDDLEIDVSNLKTVVNKPVVWLRPDENFWDKVSKGEDAYDAVSFYDVRCQPKLIERQTTINHYQNGTEIIDFVETVWDYPGDINPRELRSNQVIKNPGE